MPELRTQESARSVRDVSPAIIDAATLRGYRQDLTVSKFLSVLSPSLHSQVGGQTLGGDSILPLTITFSRVMRVSTKDGASSAPTIKKSAMSLHVAEVAIVVVTVILEGVDPLKEDVAHKVVDRVFLINDHVNADIVGGIITSLRSVGGKLVVLNWHNWLILTLLLLTVLLILHLLLLFFCLFHCAITR